MMETVLAIVGVMVFSFAATLAGAVLFLRWDSRRIAAGMNGRRRSER